MPAFISFTSSRKWRRLVITFSSTTAPLRTTRTSAFLIIRPSDTRQPAIWVPRRGFLGDQLTNEVFQQNSMVVMVPDPQLFAGGVNALAGIQVGRVNPQIDVGHERAQQDDQVAVDEVFVDQGLRASPARQ